jgi:hypothetical protein
MGVVMGYKYNMVITAVISIVGLVTIVITSISWDIGIYLNLWYICLMEKWQLNGRPDRWIIFGDTMEYTTYSTWGRRLGVLMGITMVFKPP